MSDLKKYINNRKVCSCIGQRNYNQFTIKDFSTLEIPPGNNRLDADSDIVIKHSDFIRHSKVKFEFQNSYISNEYIKAISDYDNSDIHIIDTQRIQNIT